MHPLTIICLRASLAIAFCLAPLAASAAATTLDGGVGGAAPGYGALLPVRLETTNRLVGLQFDISYPSGPLVVGTPLPGEALNGHRFDTEEVYPHRRRVIIFSLTNAPLSNGVVCWLPISAPTNAGNGVVRFPVTQAFLGKSAGVRETNAGVFSGQFLIGDAAALATDGCRVQFRALTGTTNTIQASTNLTDWTDLGQTIAIEELIVLRDQDALNVPYRFYRARQGR